MEEIRIAAFSGSLRKKSYTTSLVRAFQKLAPDKISMNLIDIGHLPLFNQDLETDLPKEVRALHELLDRTDAVMLATPEYNRSYSPVLKNALDWGSRPQGNNKWARKPVAIVGCTPYMLGAFGAVNHLRQVIMYLDMYVLQQPEFYLGKAAEKFNDDGELTDQQTKDLIEKFWQAFIGWIRRVG
jgi:chromate reductase, NAD(P)H dehydrogenase (quinone)